MLELFQEYHVQGTFFVLGLLAEKFPDVVKEIADAGHEIGTHGYSHKPVFEIGPDAFADELIRSKKLLEDISGTEVRGYRAPDFSITEDSLWALDILAEHGMSYDSSIMPVKMRRYGIDGYPRRIHRLPNGLTEVPLSTIPFAGRRWPVAGGGYLRLYPLSVTVHAINRLQSQAQPAIVYLHPYELDATEMREFRPRMPYRTRLSQGLNRRFVAQRLRRLFDDFHFAPLQEVITDHVDSTQSVEFSCVSSS